MRGIVAGTSTEVGQPQGTRATSSTHSGHQRTSEITSKTTAKNTVS